jgi:hypothetical protein
MISFVPTEETRPRRCTASAQGTRAPNPRPTGEQATNGFPRTPTDATRAIPDLPRPQALDLTLGLLGALEHGIRMGVEPRSPSAFAGQSWANGYDDACHGTSFRPASADVDYDYFIATSRTTCYFLQKMNCSWLATPASVATVERLGKSPPAHARHGCSRCHESPGRVSLLNCLLIIGNSRRFMIT